MNKAALRKELTPAERIELACDLWDSIAPEEHPPLTDAQKQELERRHEALVRDPTRGSKWEDVRARLWSKYK